MSNPDDRCAGTARDGGPCTFTRAGHADVEPHAFVEPSWCPTCLKERIYTASCEHMKPAPQTESAPGFCGRCLDVQHCNRIGQCADRGEGDGDEAGRFPGNPDADAAVRAKLGADEMATAAIVHKWHGYSALQEHNMWQAVREAFAAGAREEREEMAQIVAGFIKERERKVNAGHGTKTIIELRVVKQIADAIARRGKESK